ncbi:two-component system sensor histidine kinase CssS [Geomicrobium halophilum]|uniref:histidine kinase n=1 Tax=Geomicrobium halophilum TaxID=549000 RepID=A0A841PP18_9BACL|nr:HAMP domain-containing sensor histidine kinase [Geomicrobium halophilum]MBB6449544.1 two-component system sensor histidine kinase CssS [Geomicrobium halophilum]
MIRMNLTRRIWLSFLALLVLLGLSLTIIYPLSIQGTLTEETYRIIEQHQQQLVSPLSGQFSPPTTDDALIDPQSERDVGTIYIADQVGGSATGEDLEDILEALPEEVEDAVPEMVDQAFAQEQGTGRYEVTNQDSTIFYVVTQVDAGDDEDVDEILYISFMLDSYRDSMVNQLWENLVYLMLITAAFSLLPVMWLTRYLRKPLRLLGSHFEQIAKRNWKEPFHWEGDEDFQKLSDQFELMRQNLIRYDNAQKTFIQHASHELKTPIMVVKTYAQSVKDGVLPKKTVEETMDVILQESNRMDQRVKDMLYFTKLGNLKKETINLEDLSFGALAYRLEERYRLQRDDLQFVVQGADIIFKGDREHIQVLLENLIENAMRYAESTIWIRAEQTKEEVILIVENDGDPIDEEDMQTMFDPFRKGNKGQFGLGLAIVRQITELHHGRHGVVNENGRVSFQMTLPRQI